MRLPADALGDWTGRTVLVTGGAGYLGRFLARALRSLGATVRTFDLARRDEPGVEAVVGDLRDPRAVHEAVDGCEVVLHAGAAMSFLGIAPREVRDRIHGVNVGGARHVVDACRAHGVRALVATSSANVVLDRPFVDEDESAPYAARFVDLYGASKAEAERVVLAGSAGSLRTAALRPGGIWGPEEGGYMIRAFLAQLVAGRFVATMGDPRTVVDNTHVDTLVFGELLAARRLLEAPEGVAGEAFFCTDDERLNGLAWFRPVVEGLGHRWPRVNLPGGLMYAVAWAGEVSTLLGAPEPPLTRIGVLKLTRTSSCRVDKARARLGWRPLWTSPEGIAAHLDDWRAEAERLRGRP